MKPSRISLGIFLLASVFTQLSCHRQEKASAPAGPVIGVSLLNLSSEYIAQLDKALRAEAAHQGMTLVVNDAQLNADRQIQQVESFVAEKVSAIILNPCQVDASSPAVDAAIAAGIPIVNVNSETRTQPTAFVGSRDEDAGRMAMEFVAEKLSGQGGVVILEGAQGQAAQIKRFRGAQTVFAAHPGLKLLASQSADWDRAKGITLMENWIQAFPGQIKAVFAENDEMAMGALIALEQAGVKKGICVVGVDGIADALAAVTQGRLDATIYQDAVGQGKTAVIVATALARHLPYEKETFIPFRLVTKQNVAEFSEKKSAP